MSFQRREIANPAPPAAPRLHMVEQVLGGRRFLAITVPHTTPALQGRLRLLTRGEVAQVRDECRKALAAKGITAAAPGVLEGFPEWRDEMIVRTIAVAVRAVDNDEPLGSVADWSELNDVQILWCWETYQDHEATLDPFGGKGPELSEDDAREMLAAAKAADVGQLTSFGSYKLARFAITSVARPPS